MQEIEVIGHRRKTEAQKRPRGGFPDPQVDYRRRPEAYRIARGEVGVLTVEPYKSELLPLWRFKTPVQARASADAIYRKFLCFKKAEDFVGMDMARKFLQMGYTRSLRYARHRSGRKYDGGGKELPANPDAQKRRSAEIFRAAWSKARADRKYQDLKQAHRRLVARTRRSKSPRPIIARRDFVAQCARHRVC